jgi:hypothetical protein
MILALLLACTGSPTVETGADASACGDPDGAGTDTGDLPNVLGAWTSTFAQNYYDDDCSTGNLSESSETWLGAFTLDGRAPDALRLSFNSADERYDGAMDPYGGVTFGGRHPHADGTLHVQLGGLVYRDQYQDRDVIDGTAFLGLDVDGDDVIDCRAKGSWKAFKSGL